MGNAPAEPPAGDPLAAFISEPATERPKVSVPLAPAVPIAPRPGRALWVLWLVGGICVGFAVEKIPARVHAEGPTAASINGTVSINTTPAGLPVSIDGGDRGMTPIVVSLEPGVHAVTITGPDAQKTTRLAIAAGQQASTFFDFGPAAPSGGRGKLSVAADAPSRVTVDGGFVGTTPVVVPDVAAGLHTVAVTSQGKTITWKTAVPRGETTSAAFSFGTPAPAATAIGWLSVAAPFDVEVFDGESLVGGSGVKLMLAAGHHDLRFVNRPLGFEESRRVDLAVGKVASVAITAPETTVDINARPWANVLIDGTAVGQTPLANVPITVGTHVVVFRNPEFGEQRRTITATTAGPNRVGVDLTSK